jgi:drug/metabolite transporter (DMT)-like permease
MTAAVVVAFAAATAFGWSTALMHHSASAAPADLNRPDRLLGHLIHQRRWVIGEIASLTGLGLHLWALSLGSLVIVQPLVATGLVFALAFRAILDRKRPSSRTLFWASVCAGGVAVFLIATNSTNGSSPVDDTRAAIMLTVGSIVAFVAWFWSLKVPRESSGLLLGIAGGVIFGLLAGSLKATTDTFGSISGILTAWPFYASCLLGLFGFLMNQRMYHQSSLHRSLPTLNTLNPIVAVIFGIFCFNERPGQGASATIAEVAGLVAMLAAIYFLARSDEAVAAVS